MRLGVLFCFFLLLPFAVPFLIGYKTEHLKPIIKIGEYIDFTLKFMLGAGAVFELPLVIVLLEPHGDHQCRTPSRNSGSMRS